MQPLLLLGFVPVRGRWGAQGMNGVSVKTKNLYTLEKGKRIENGGKTEPKHKMGRAA